MNYSRFITQLFIYYTRMLIFKNELKNIISRNGERGISALEILVGLSIIILVLGGVVAAFQEHLSVGLRDTNEIKAAYLAEEGIEAVRFLRDNNWSAFSSLAMEFPYYLYYSTTTSAWEATTTAQTIDGEFQRTFVLERVYRRNSDDDIIPLSDAAAKTLDPETKKVTVRVTWEGKAAELMTYLTNLFKS